MPILEEAKDSTRLKAGTATEELLACPMSVASAVEVLIRKTKKE